MGSYIIRRLLLLPVVLVGISIMVFGMMQLLSPYQRLSAFVSNPTKLTASDPQDLIRKYGLDKPFYIQYFRWLNNVFHGNLGYSSSVSLPVATAIARFFPATLELILFSVMPIIIFGIWFGTIAATRHNRSVDHLSRVMSIIGWSLPTFVAGLVTLMIFYGVLGWFPPGRISTSSLAVSMQIKHYTGMYTVDALINGKIDLFVDALRHLVTPIFTLSLVSWALILRITRSSMLETLRQDYITTARAKGVSERMVIRKHALRNALIPVITISGLMMAGMVGGVVVVETVFDYKGIGWWAAQAARQFDFSAIVGFTLFNATLLVLINLVVDLFYAVADPRIRLQ